MNESVSTKKATILVVDDTPESLGLMSNLLKDDYKVKIANSGEQALNIAASSLPPDLVLLDIMMPGMDGYEICRRLKQDPRTENIPVIFVTSMAEVDDEKKGLELGAIDYITKPISPPIVLARVKNHLALKAMSDFLRNQNDWDLAEKLALTLKGVSGNVSVTGMQQFAEKLDAAIKEHRANKQSESGLDGSTAKPEGLIEKFNQTLLQEQEKTASLASHESLKMVCDKLGALLIDDNAEASDVLDENAEMLSAAFPDQYRKIDDYVRAFKFKEAFAELRVAASATIA